MKTLRLGIAGLGHVGCALIKLIENQARLRLPGKIEIAGVSARDKYRTRQVAISDYRWFDDPVKLAKDAQVDIFVELIGGSQTPARTALESALKAKKHAVTANKALIAMHGQTLEKLAVAQDVDLMFEAAIAGGIPVVRVLRDSLTGVAVNHISGILNGTCNYMTTRMLETGLPYQSILEEAQKLGYAEADPGLDISGMDAAHKIMILAAIAFTATPDFSKVSLRGIEAITTHDLNLANRLGLRIKLVAEAFLQSDSVVCRVEPKALPLDHTLASVNGVLNTVRIKGEPLGTINLTGPGAGPGPTASAVIGDIAKLFRPAARSPFGRARHHIDRTFTPATQGEHAAFFLRADLNDKPGTLAALTEVLANNNVSVDKLVQDSADKQGQSPVAIITHACQRMDMDAACRHARTHAAVMSLPQAIPIMDETA